MTEAQREWERCRPWIVAALEHGPGLESIEDVERLISEGRYSFWPGANCAAVCEVADYGQGKVLTLVHAGGDMKELVEVIEPAICNYARGLGCRAMLVVGRKGWERVCKGVGYEFACITMMKAL